MTTHVKKFLFRLFKDEKGSQTMEVITYVAISLMAGIAIMAFMGVNSSGESTGGGMMQSLLDIAGKVLPGINIL